MRPLLILILLCASGYIFAQSNNAAFLSEVKDFQDKMNSSFKDSLTSPLKKEDLLVFTTLDFFSANDNFRLAATFKRTPKEKAFRMKTSTDRLPEYLKYGVLFFQLNGKEYQLNVYQNLQLMKKDGYVDYLFLPFTDLTNGTETYGGGRYIDFKIPRNKKVFIDFNKAYNPYCAYNSAYSCPIPPPENFINEEVRAGVKHSSK